MMLYLRSANSKRTTGVPSANLTLKRNQFSVFFGTMTHVLTISSQLVAVLYFSLRALAVPAATLVLAAGLLGRQLAPSHCTN
jgi:hypothetical protein